MKGSGTIVSLKGNKAFVRVFTSAGCSGCAESGHCMSGKAPDREIAVLNDIGAAVSDRIVFEAEPGKVVFASLLIWIVPILAMIVGYLVGKIFGGGAIPIVGAFGFLVLSFAALGMIDRLVSGGRTFYPHITAVVPPGEDAADACHLEESNEGAW